MAERFHHLNASDIFHDGVCHLLACLDSTLPLDGIIKGIKYLRRKEERDTQRDYRSAQNTIDEIERELNDRK